MDPKKIEAIRSIDTTQIDSLSKVRSFLGLASYYRRFVKGFAGIAAPLHDMTKEGVDVAVESQTPKAQAAMQQLIGALVSEPVLATPRFDRQFIVKTDAAITEGIGPYVRAKVVPGGTAAPDVYGTIRLVSNAPYQIS